MYIIRIESRHILLLQSFDKITNEIHKIYSNSSNKGRKMYYESKCYYYNNFEILNNFHVSWFLFLKE